MNIPQKISISLLLLAGFGFATVSWGMEEGGQITLVSAEGVSVSISRGAAELSGTFKEMLEDHSFAARPVPLSEVSTNTLQSVVRILERVKSGLTPRQVDGRYAPYKVQPIVAQELTGQPFDQIQDTLLAANYLAIPFLINAAARELVYKAPYLVAVLSATRPSRSSSRCSSRCRFRHTARFEHLSQKTFEIKRGSCAKRI